MGEKERLYPKLTGVIGPTVRSMKRDIREKWRYSRYIRETEIKSRPRGGSRSNQYQSIKRFIPDRFTFRLFPQQFSIYLRHRNVCPPQNLLLLLLFYLILLSSTLFPRLSPLSSRSPSNHPLIRPKTRPSTAGQVLPRQKGSGDSRPRAYHRPCEPCESLGSPISSSLAGCNIEKSRH